MRVRCGACRTQFEVAGSGRYACPVCGSVNVVRAAGPQDQAEGGFFEQQAPPPALARITCPECEFSFVVGRIAVATCPNCNAQVPTGQDVEEDREQ